MANLSNKKEDLEEYQSLRDSLNDNKDLIDLVELSDEDETETLKDVDSNLKDLSKTINSLKLKTQLDGEYDRNNA